MTDTSSAGNVSDRMQALLSRAVEEQVSEQRAASNVLSDLRDQLAASNDAVTRLDASITTVVADQRTATTLLSQRLEVLATRIEELGRLGDDVTAQAAALDEVRRALDIFASFPGALSALQTDVAGLHSRLAPLADVQAAVGELSARSSGSVESLRPELDALAAKVGTAGAAPDLDRLRDSVVDALTTRLERLQQAAERPVVGPEVLRSGLGDVRASINASVGDQLEPISATLTQLSNRIDHLDGAVNDVGVLTGGIPAVATELATIKDRLEKVEALRAQLETLSAEPRPSAEPAGTATTAALEALQADVAKLADQVAAIPALSTDEISAQVSIRVADRLVETLAPRIADVVLTRVGAALVNQLGESLAPQVTAQTEELVRAATAESERRILAHVDDGLLTLAEALLRRKPPAKRPAKATAVPQEPVAEVVQRVVEEPAEKLEEATEVPVAARPAVTTGLAPAPVQATAPPRPTPEETAPSGAVHTPSPVRPARAATRKAAPAKARPAKAAEPTESGAKPTPAKRAARPAKATGAPRPAAKARPPLLEQPSRPHVERPVGPPAPPAAAPTPAAPPPAPPSAPPAAPPGSFAPATVPPPPPVGRPVEPPKRKPWWRPGG